MTRGVAWNAIGTACNQGSTLVVNVVLAHLLAQNTFGQYAVLLTTLSVVAAFAQVATGYTAAKYVAEYRDHDKDRAGRILGLCALVSVTMGVLAAVALFLGAERIARVLAEVQLTSSLRITAVIVLFNVMSGFLSGALAGLESYPSLGKAGVISGTAYILLCVLGGVWGGVNGALAGAAASAGVQSAILWKLLLDSARQWQIVIEPAGALQESEVLRRFSIPAALTGLVSLPAPWTASALLARREQGFDELALFSAANSFRLIVLFLPNILNTVGMSLLNNQLGAGEEASYRRLFWQNVAGTAAIVLASVSAVALTGRWLLVAFGHEFVSAYPVLLVLMLAALAEGLAIVAFQVIQTRGRIWISLFGVAIPSNVVLVAVAAWLTPIAGAVGLAWGYAGCWLVALMMECLVVWRIGIWPSRR